MIQRLVGLALRLRAVIVVLTAALIGVGLLAYRHLDIEAYPNPVPPLGSLGPRWWRKPTPSKPYRVCGSSREAMRLSWPPVDSGGC